MTWGYNCKRFKDYSNKECYYTAYNAERSLLEEELMLQPLLLLDDVFEKLDPARIHSLLQWVAHHTTSQVFITDTDPSRLRDQLDPLQIPWELLEIKGIR